MPASNDATLAYALLRFAFGINLALHGLNRILGGAGLFASKMTEDFAHTLPRALVYPFGVVLPFLELSIGVLLVLGAFTRPALVAGSLLMAALMFGTALKGDWNVLGTQLVYSLAYYVLLSRRVDDGYGIDAWRFRGKFSRDI
ncbi:MAG TPA: DoxX family membrane protein [Polyangiaceae bacterium]|jgi:thiosulfate dehydrogenase [quinone] large subunit|nr:DoxX family membrane protein [Polyangiaceae bacterium]